MAKTKIIRDPNSFGHTAPKKQYKPLLPVAWAKRIEFKNIDQIARYLFRNHGVSVGMYVTGTLSEQSMQWAIQCGKVEVKDYQDGRLRSRYPAPGDYLIEFSTGTCTIMTRGRYLWYLRKYREQQQLNTDSRTIYDEAAQQEKAADKGLTADPWNITSNPPTNEAHFTNPWEEAHVDPNEGD